MPWRLFNNGVLIRTLWAEHTCRSHYSPAPTNANLPIRVFPSFYRLRSTWNRGHTKGTLHMEELLPDQELRTFEGAVGDDPLQLGHSYHLGPVFRSYASTACVSVLTGKVRRLPWLTLAELYTELSTRDDTIPSHFGKAGNFMKWKLCYFFTLPFNLVNLNRKVSEALFPCSGDRISVESHCVRPPRAACLEPSSLEGTLVLINSENTLSRNESCKQCVTPSW
jgi:hypothetical protein